jgi:hypothetical protein
MGGHQRDGGERRQAGPTEEELATAARLLREHADDIVSRVCPICRVSRCQVWREADGVALRGLIQGGGTRPSGTDQGTEGR